MPGFVSLGFVIVAQLNEPYWGIFLSSRREYLG